ncbi:hypothetical protein MRX96_012162 [Rhipicephalus microplus]
MEKPITGCPLQSRLGTPVEFSGDIPAFEFYICAARSRCLQANVDCARIQASRSMLCLPCPSPSVSSLRSPVFLRSLQLTPASSFIHGHPTSSLYKYGEPFTVWFPFVMLGLVPPLMFNREV